MPYTTSKKKVVGFRAEVDKDEELRMEIGLVGALEVAIRRPDHPNRLRFRYRGWDNGALVQLEKLILCEGCNKRQLTLLVSVVWGGHTSEEIGHIFESLHCGPWRPRRRIQKG